jgi:hypothetical protein
VLDYLSLLIAHSARSFLSFHPIPVFCLRVSTSESRHHFSLSCTLSPQVLLNFLCHTLLIDTPSCILYLESRFFDSLPYFLLVDVFLPFTQLYIHSSCFCSQSFHFFTGIPVPLVVGTSPSLSLSFFFSFQHSASILYTSLPSILSSTLPLSFPLSLSAYSSYTISSLCNLVFLCPLLAPISNISLALNLPSLVPSIPRFLPVHQYSLYHGLKHHHSPPEITSLLSLSYSSHTPLLGTLFAFITLSLMCSLSVALSLKVLPKYLN